MKRTLSDRFHDWLTGVVAKSKAWWDDFGREDSDSDI